MKKASSSQFLYGIQAKRTVHFLLVGDGGVKISRPCFSHRLVIAFDIKDNILRWVGGGGKFEIDREQ